MPSVCPCRPPRGSARARVSRRPPHPPPPAPVWAATHVEHARGLGLPLPRGAAGPEEPLVPQLDGRVVAPAQDDVLRVVEVRDAVHVVVVGLHVQDDAVGGDVELGDRVRVAGPGDDPLRRPAHLDGPDAVHPPLPAGVVLHAEVQRLVDVGDVLHAVHLRVRVEVDELHDGADGGVGQELVVRRHGRVRDGPVQLLGQDLLVQPPRLGRRRRPVHPDPPVLEPRDEEVPRGGEPPDVRPRVQPVHLARAPCRRSRAPPRQSVAPTGGRRPPPPVTRPERWRGGRWSSRRHEERSC